MDPARSCEGVFQPVNHYSPTFSLPHTPSFVLTTHHSPFPLRRVSLTMAPHRQLTSFEKTIPDYRKRILIALSQALLLPPFFTVFGLRVYFRQTLSPVYVALLALLSIPATILVRSYCSLWAQDHEAARLGARPIPRVQGKWPGNFDVVLKIIKSFETEYVFQGFSDLFEEYQCTTINTRFFWSDQIVTMDESVIKFVAVTGFDQFEKGNLWHERMNKFLGTGLFNAEGDVWKKGRATARPFFAKERISDFEIFGRTSKTTLDILAGRASRHQPIDIQDLLSRFTLDSAALYLWGHALNTLSQPLTQPGRVKLGPRGSIPIDGNTEFDVFTEAFERVAVIVRRRAVQGGSWPLLELFKDSVEEPIEIIGRWLDPLVKKAVARKDQRKRDGVTIDARAEDTVFLDFLAQQSDNVEHIRYELLTFLIASRETTTSVLTFTVYFFALHPEVCIRLRQEVLETFGSEETPVYEKLKSMKYLRAVINETLRLFPSAPLIVRMSRDTPLVLPQATSTSPAPLHLPPHTQVMMLSLLLHRRHDLWGPDADEFKPERWFDEAFNTKVNATPFMYSPFYGGPRVCIGQEFALNEIGYFLVRLLQRFQCFRLAPEFMPQGSLPPAHWKGKPGRQGMEQVLPAQNITIHSRGGMWMFAEPASAA
ncbi:cytochrome P450 monooxygenase CYP63 [Artomyces pyxidatus]|uniref:Cytochrome P450 monooxygenase CYP63 n=1 Tax=Artomyces pyxidatus TaxID=48021 RepID=A0ACB8SSZ0_9AGAM|nr:cytochrome P450 monooxygenase CYP63 [Artomyces pyxidatus]